VTDQYYSSNVGAKLFMGQSTSVPLPAPGSDTFLEVPLLGSVTPPPFEQSVGRFNIQNDSARRSVGGRLLDQIVPFNVVLDWSEQVHKDIEADVKVAGGRKRNWYILYPDSGARRDDFVAFVSKFEKEAFDAGEDAKEHRGTGELSVDGTVTVTY
jgi:hypothetical protein